jgi:hypothetical protein
MGNREEEKFEKALERELKRDVHKRSITELVDDFIEGVAEGSVLFLTAKVLNTSEGKLWGEMGLGDLSIKYYKDMTNEIINDLIPRYTESKGNEKKSIAYEIYKKILAGRSIGLIYNDSNFVKELNWYRIQNEFLNDENGKLRKYVTGLTNRVLELSKS